jgi:hypothetical protein
LVVHFGLLNFGRIIDALLRGHHLLLVTPLLVISLVKVVLEALQPLLILIQIEPLLIEVYPLDLLVTY